jgi:TolA-binding protein
MSQHPAEDLLVRARRGELGDDEARRFEIAVGSSRELELLYEAGAEFDAQAELLPGDEERMSALVSGVLQNLERTEPLRSTLGVGPAPRRRSNAWFFATNVGFGVLLSVARASAWQVVERQHWFGGAPPRPPAPVAAVRDTATRATAPAIAASPPLAPSPAAASSVPLAAKPSRRIAGSGLAPSSPAVEVGALEPAAAPAPATPSELFVRANEARRSGAHDAAVALYEELIARYPSSLEAEDARLLIGNLRLSERSPGAALGEFERYDGGALTPEALWGKARALRSLQSAEERSVLERIVREYPESPYANGAQQRLLQLAP